MAATKVGIAAKTAVTTSVRCQAPRPQPGHYAQADSQHHDDQGCVKDQPGGGPDPRRDQRGHVLLQRDRDHEVPVQCIVEPVLGKERSFRW